MQRIYLLVMLLLVACQPITRVDIPQTTEPSPTAYTAAAPTATARIEPSIATATATKIAPVRTLPATKWQLTGVAPATLPAVDEFQVVFHPDGDLYVGDLISLEVIAPQGANLDSHSLQLEAPGAESVQTTNMEFGRFGIAGRPQATLFWSWNTAGLEAGTYDLNLSVLPDGPQWVETVALLPEHLAPPPQPDAAWRSAESDCCLVYYITGTDVARDLDLLLATIDRQAAHALEYLPTALESAIEITLLPRVLGHGGFARSDINVSYLDRNYAGEASSIVLHHEMVHILDSKLGGELRPTILVEGLAVYLSGGHFKIEPLMPRAAALLPPKPGCSAAGSGDCGLDRYIPFVPLVDNFYFEQHEIGYLLAGALVEFMVEQWGWQAFSDFYRDIHPAPAPVEQTFPRYGDQARALDRALQAHFDISLETLEAEFLAALGEETLTEDLVDDVRLTIRFYDTMRRYQVLLDPSAYFLTAWLPDNEQMRERGIVADYVRHPVQAENLALETMLTAADAHLRTADYDKAEELILAVESILDAYPQTGLQAFAGQPIGKDYLNLVLETRKRGYMPQRIQVLGEDARVWANIPGEHTVVFEFVRFQGGWQFLAASG